MADTFREFQDSMEDRLVIAPDTGEPVRFQTISRNGKRKYYKAYLEYLETGTYEAPYTNEGVLARTEGTDWRSRLQTPEPGTSWERLMERVEETRRESGRTGAPPEPTEAGEVPPPEVRLTPEAGMDIAEAAFSGDIEGTLNQLGEIFGPDGPDFAALAQDLIQDEEALATIPSAGAFSVTQPVVVGPSYQTPTGGPPDIQDPLITRFGRPTLGESRLPTLDRLAPDEAIALLYDLDPDQLEQLQRGLISAGFLTDEPRYGKVNANTREAYAELLAETQRRAKAGNSPQLPMESVLFDLRNGGWQITELNDPDAAKEELRPVTVLTTESLAARFQEIAVAETGKPIDESLALQFAGEFQARQRQAGEQLQTAEGAAAVQTPGAADIDVSAASFIRDRFPTEAKAKDIQDTIGFLKQEFVS